MGIFFCKDNDNYEKISYISRSSSSKVYLIKSKRKLNKKKQKVCKEFKITIDVFNPDFTDIIHFLHNNPHRNIIEIQEIKYNFNKPLVYQNVHLPSISMYMEYIENDLFEYHINNNISFEDRKNIGYSIVEAVEFLHSNNIIHGDLKLENMMIDKNNNVKLIDFEASIYNDSCALNNSILKTTMDFLSPEKYFNEDIGFYNDIWALGLVFYILFEYELPFLCKQLVNEQQTPHISFQLKDDCFKHLILNMLNYDPKKRFTIKEVKEHAFWI